MDKSSGMGNLNDSCYMLSEGYNAEQQIDIYFRYIGKLVPEQVA